MQKRYVAVGTGGRVVMFINPIAEKYRDSAKLVGLCDISRIRMEFHVARLKEEYGYDEEIALYPAEDFDRMLEEQKPDAVIVCSVDATHADYIVRSVKAGCDVIVEKPIAINAEQCAAIQDAVRSSGKNVRVTFNYRWSPGVSKVRELIRSGVIGKIHHVNLQYLLDTRHGADYFRRWHANMNKSGGLLVHKSTHHFDLVNWWLDSIPDRVFANGNLAFYGKKNAIARGDDHLTGYERYTGSGASSDPFYIDLSDSKLYFDAEKDSGYIRDRNVFRDDVDIYDTMSVTATYRSGAILTYSLVAYCPYEGFRVSFAGDRGRIEYSELHGSHLIMGQDDKDLAAEQARIAAGQKHHELIVYPHFSPSYEVEVPLAEGGHGGGDPLIQEQIFSNDPPAENLNRNAGWEQGMASALLGISANRSIETGLPVRVNDLVSIRPNASKLSELT